MIAVCGYATAAWSYDAQLGWSPVGGTAGYKVYVRQSGQSYSAGTDAGSPVLGSDGQLHFVVAGLPAGVTNFFAVTDYSSGGAESALSNELSLMVMPTPTPAASTTGTVNTAVPTATRTAVSTAIATATRTATSIAPPSPTASSTAIATRTVATPTATPSHNTTPPPTANGATIWGPTATPGLAADPDTAAVELGVKFTSDVNGRVTGIRFYKSTTNTGTHTGTLWSSAGALLATATFSNETASGWQQVNFATPVAVTAGTVYVASYHTTVGRYAADAGYFATAGFDNPPLHALRDGVSGGNGAYVYGASAFPTNTFQSSNYWVDVVFSTTATSTATSSSTQTSTPTATATQTAKPTLTPTARPATATSTAMATITAARTATSTTTLTATTTRTATASATNTSPPTSTTTATATRTRTATATYTATPPPTATATNSASPSTTATRTASATSTATATNTSPPTRTATATATTAPNNTATATYTTTPLPTDTATATVTNTRPPTATATATATNTSPPTRTATATTAPINTATATYTTTPPPTDTATATATSSTTPNATASATHTAEPSATATAADTATPVPTDTAAAAATDTAAPISTATPTLTAEPTSTATAADTTTPLPTDPPTATATSAATYSATPTATAIDTLAPTATQPLTPTPTATPVPDWSVTIPTDVRVRPGKTVSVPVDIAAGSGVRGLALRVTYDPTVVGVQGVQLSADAGTGVLDANSATPGDLSVSATLLQPMTASGALVDVSFSAVGSCPSSTVLHITSCVLDGGAVGCQPSDGSIDVRCGVGGRIRHWRSNAPVSGTMVTMVGARGSATSQTNDLGQFGFDETTSGTWQLEPQKSGDLQRAVTAFDAALVLQAVAGAQQLDPVQTLACDVTGNGQVSALDAARILQLAVGQRQRLPIAETCGSDWAFIPDPLALPNQRLIQPQPGGRTCQAGAIVLDPVLGDAPQQDFTAVLFGDCSGNWTPSLQSSARLRLAHDVRVRVGAARSRRGGQWAVPIYVASSRPFHALDAQLSYDPAALPATLRAVGVARDAMVDYGTDGHGTLTVGLASTAPLTGDGGPVALLVFDAPSRKTGATLARLLQAAVDETDVGIGN